MKRRVGIVGYGHIGQYLTKAVQDHPDLELAFIWNRTRETMAKDNVPEELILDNLDNLAERKPDLIVEVAHPVVVKQYGVAFLQTCDFFVGSPTSLADDALLESLTKEASTNQEGRGLYVPSGAFWGGEDIRKMADRGTLKGLRVTMRKHPSCFKLTGALKEKNAEVTDQLTVLYDGPVRQLCPLAPNNVNSMAAACVAAHNLGFDGVQGRLMADPSLADWHYVEVEALGPTKNGRTFSVETVRKNPAEIGAVTGSATYVSFFSSLLLAGGKGCGVHLC